MSIRVAIADDQALVRAGFRKLVETEPDLLVVGEATNGSEACDVVQASAPDVILMDIRMPVTSGIEATRRLAALGSATRVLILTTYDLDEYVFDALAAGASGFLLKDAPPEQLVTAIRTVANGDALLDPTVTRRLITRFVQRRPDGHLRHRLATLTDRETEVLRLLAEGLSNSEIGSRIHLGGATIKTHVSSLLLKLGLRDRVQAVVFAYESGLVEPGSRPPR